MLKVFTLLTLWIVHCALCGLSVVDACGLDVRKLYIIQRPHFQLDRPASTCHPTMDPQPAAGTLSALSKNLSNRIAPEIYDAVIDNLHSDKPTLKKCSRVCKSWIPASRYHLVQRVKLHPAQIGRFCELVEPSVSTFPQQFVHLEMRHDPPLWTPWEQSILPNSKPRLPGMRLDKSAHLIGLLPRFTALSSVEIVNVNFTSFGQLADIVCVLPMLERVVLEAVTWVDDEFDVATLVKPLGVKSLSMHCWDNTHIINWLISRERLPLIKKLSLSERTTSGGELLKVLGSSLESLELRLAVYQPDPEGNVTLTVVIHELEYHLLTRI